jgi:choline-sulfatase
LIDLAPTLVELSRIGDGGNVGFGSHWDGESLAGLLSDRSPGLHGPVVCEYHAEGVNRPAAMIRDGRHKLIVCTGDPDQLFDLEADPRELSNLASRPEHAATVQTLRDALADRLDLPAIERRVLSSQSERHLVARALARGEVTAWDFQPFVDASGRYVRTREDLHVLHRIARLDAR